MKPHVFPLIAVLTALAFVACKDNPSEPAGAPSLVGVWLTETSNGTPVLSAGITWFFSSTSVTMSVAAVGCQTSMYYSQSGAKLLTRIIEDGCVGVPAGERDTATYSVSVNVLTITSDSVTMKLRRMTGNDRVIGTWMVTKVDNAALPAGNAMNLYLTDQVLRIQTITGAESCITTFTYQNFGSRLGIIAVEDECGNVEAGTDDDVDWTVSSDTLTLVFSDGTKIEAKRV